MFKLFGAPKKSRKKVKGSALKLFNELKADRKEFEKKFNALFKQDKAFRELYKNLRFKLKQAVYDNGVYTCTGTYNFNGAVTTILPESALTKNSAILERLSTSPELIIEPYTEVKSTFFSAVLSFWGHSNFRTIQVSFVFQLKEESLDFLKDFVVEGDTKLINRFMQTYWTENTIDTVLDATYKVQGKFKQSGIIKLLDGTFFYLPPDMQAFDGRKDYFTELAEGKTPRNQLVLIDPTAEVFIQTNSVGNLETIPLRGSSKPTPADIKYLLEQTFSEAVSSTSYPNSLFNLWNAFGRASSVEEFNKIGFNSLALSDKKLHELQEDGMLLPTIRKLKEIYEEKRSNVLPTTYLTVIAKVQMIIENAKNYEKIKKQVEENRKAFDAATSKDIPPLANLADDFFLLAHQAEALAKNNVGGELAALEIATGGGKTSYTICDVINLLVQGKIKRPLIVMPKGLISNWVDEIHRFTACKMNAFAIVRETIKNWSDKKHESGDPKEAIAEMIRSATLNTIFLTSYSTLSAGGIKLPWGGFEYPNANWIKEVLNPDYVCLDESHFCKNPKASRTNAVYELKSAPYRRIMSGTLISNKPSDLIGQAAFLDPNIVGDTKEFAARYALGVDNYGNATGWKSNAAELIRKDLREKVFYVRYSEKDWAPALPQIEYGYHLVQMTNAQKAVYKDLVRETLQEILKDPHLKEAWTQLEALMANPTEGDEAGGDPFADFNFFGLFAKLINLEQYLTAPDLNQFIAKSKNLAPEDKVSPKLKEIDKLIEKSIAAGHKCIVAVHYKASAAHLIKHSKFRDQAVYYDAQQSDAFLEFKKNSKIKVMFAVVQSLMEGHNLQMADRIIVADKDWTPGKEKQLIARIFRPHIGRDPATGERRNLNEGKTVYIDYVLCDNSADLLKMCYQTFKKLFNAQIMEESPIQPPLPPALSEDNLLGSSSLLNFDDFYTADTKYNDWFKAQIEEYKQTKDFSLVKPQIVKGALPETVIKTPWMPGMELPDSAGGKSVTKFLEENGIAEGFSLKDEQVKKLLIGRYVATEFGQGKVVSIRSDRKLTIVDADGEKSSVDFRKAKVLEKSEIAIDRKKKRIVKEIEVESFDDEDNSVSLEMVSINDIPALRAELADPDSVSLKKAGFVYQGEYWDIKLRSKKHGNEILDLLDTKYNIPTQRMNQCREVVENMTRAKYEYQLPEGFKTFYKVAHKPAPKGTLKIYPIVDDNWNVHLMVDKKVHKGVNLARFRFTVEPGYWYFFGGTAASIKQCLAKIAKLGIEVSNLAELKKAAKTFKIKL